MAKKRLDIDFRTNFVNADYNAKLIYRCSTSEDIRVAQSAIYNFLENKIQEFIKEERSGN